MTPIYDPQSNFFYGNTFAAQEPSPDPKEMAPGFQLSDLDRLLREHYARGHREGQRKARAAGDKQIAQEREWAAEQAREQAESDLLKWMWPNVMHKVLTASEAAASVLDGPKSTIANDRKTVDRILTVLKQSLHSFHQRRAT